jgi:hypothetical protein
MTAGALPMTQHSAPQADRSTVHESFFALFGAPMAWFVQLCSGYAMASQPCFIDGDRSWLPAVGLQWTWLTMIAVMLTAIIIALFALALSWRAYRCTQNQAPGDAQHLMEVGSTGRTRFLALWGIVLAAGFSGATAVNTVAFVLLPRCSG